MAIRFDAHGRISKRRLVLIAVAVIAVLAGIFLLIDYLENRGNRPEAKGDFNARYQYDETVQVDGHTYRRKVNLTTILLMGIDDYAESGPAIRNREGGQADFLRLVVIDKNAKRVSQLAIDRDTMTPITILGVTGKESGKRTLQISLSHAFGNGKERSCELTRQAVEEMLSGSLLRVRIDNYISMKLAMLPILNDALGGVTVTVEDEFNDPSLPLGATVRLQGDQVETFVRSRMTVGDGTNASRMRRQQQFISAATALLNEKLHQDDGFVDSLYDELNPYLVKDISKSRLSLEMYGAKDYARPEVYEIPGDHVRGSDGFAEFHADEKQMQQIALTLFYDQLN
jgi:LCP family protein required for cell wall assembly